MPRYNPQQYRDAKAFLDRLNSVRRYLSRDAFLTLKGQALSGDVVGAVKGLGRILARDGRAEAVNLCKFCGGPLVRLAGHGLSCPTCGRYCLDKCQQTMSVRGWHYEPCASCEHNPYRLRYEWNGGKWVMRE